MSDTDAIEILLGHNDIAARVESFGTLHGIPADYDLVLDLGDFLRDPHVSPQMRYATGMGLLVRANVLTAEGMLIAGALTDAVLGLIATAPPGRVVRVGLACRGGRHRSVALAEEVALRVYFARRTVLVVHHHVQRDVVERHSAG